MDNLEKGLQEGHELYEKVYMYYHECIEQSKSMNIHEILLLNNQLWQFINETYDHSTEMVDASELGEMYRYLVSLTKTYRSTSELISSTSAGLFYTEDQVTEIYNDYIVISDSIYELSKRELGPRLLAKLYKLTEQYIDYEAELTTVCNKDEKFLKSRIDSFTGWFKSVYLNMSDEVVIVEDGIFEDPYYIKFWQQVIENAYFDSELLDEYVNNIHGASRNDIYRYIPQTAINLFVNLNKVINRVNSSWSDLQKQVSSDAILNYFPNESFAEYLRGKINN